jgi:hypothetical protein
MTKGSIILGKESSSPKHVFSGIVTKFCHIGPLLYALETSNTLENAKNGQKLSFLASFW